MYGQRPDQGGTSLAFLVTLVTEFTEVIAKEVNAKLR